MSTMEPDEGVQPGDEQLDDGAEVPPEELQAEDQDERAEQNRPPGSGADRPIWQ